MTTSSDFKTTEIYSFLVLEARNLRSSCQQGHAPSESSREEPFLSLPSFWWLPTILGVPWIEGGQKNQGHELLLVYHDYVV